MTARPVISKTPRDREPSFFGLRSATIMCAPDVECPMPAYSSDIPTETISDDDSSCSDMLVPQENGTRWAEMVRKYCLIGVAVMLILAMDVAVAYAFAQR